MTVGNQTGGQVDQEVREAAMAGMFDLRDVLELVIDGLNDAAFTQQEFVGQNHEVILHVGFDTGDKLNTGSVEEFFEQRLGDVALVAKKFAKHRFDQIGNWDTVVHIARSKRTRQQFAQIATNHM